MNTPEALHPTPDGPMPGARVFATTRWSVVLATRASDPATAASALEHLCRTYWYPLYAQVRRSGATPPDAEDLTQAFFSRLLEKDWLASADPGRGRFRSFLSAAFQHFLANERDRAQALKRGGGTRILSLDLAPGEERLGQEPCTDRTAEQDFDRRWALALLDTVFGRLQHEYEQSGKAALFAQLKGTVTVDSGDLSGAETARTLGMSEGAVRVAAHRLRQRYREILREEIASTLASPGDVEEELRHLFTALTR